MAKIHRIIPFGLWPANWGMTGTRRAKAYAEYHYDGKDLAYQLLSIEYPDENEQELDPNYKLAKLKLDHKYGEIGEYDYAVGLVKYRPDMADPDRERELAKVDHKYGMITSEDLEYRLLDLSYVAPEGESYERAKLRLDLRFGRKTEEEVELAQLAISYEDNLESIDYMLAKAKVEHRFGHLTENQYEKLSATILREPWFNIVGADRNIRGENVNMAIELDWNEFFVDFLRSKGWVGVTDDEIVDKWFEEAMRQMLDIDQDGNDIDDGSDDPLPSVNSHIRKSRTDDGKTEYS